MLRRTHHQTVEAPLGSNVEEGKSWQKGVRREGGFSVDKKLARCYLVRIPSTRGDDVGFGWLVIESHGSSLVQIFGFLLSPFLSMSPSLCPVLPIGLVPVVPSIKLSLSFTFCGGFLACA